MESNSVTVLLQNSTIVRGGSTAPITKEFLIKAKKDGILRINKIDTNVHYAQGQGKSSACYINFDNILSITVD